MAHGLHKKLTELSDIFVQSANNELSEMIASDTYDTLEKDLKVAEDNQAVVPWFFRTNVDVSRSVDFTSTVITHDTDEQGGQVEGMLVACQTNVDMNITRV